MSKQNLSLSEIEEISRPLKKTHLDAQKENDIVWKRRA
jgi:hypothetical protein